MADMEFWDKTDFSYTVAGDDREIELQVYIDAECLAVLHPYAVDHERVLVGVIHQQLCRSTSLLREECVKTHGVR